MKIVKKIEILSRKNINKQFDFVVWLVELDDGKKGIWRPLPNLNGDYGRGVLFYEICKIIKFDFVPKTIYYEYNGQSGILREYIKGTSTKDFDNFYKIKINFESMQKLAIVDFITLNVDRGVNNIILNEKGECFAIDNDVTFIRDDGISFNISYCMNTILCEGTIKLINIILDNKQNILDKLTEYKVNSKIIEIIRRRIICLKSVINLEDTLLKRFGI